MRHVIWMGKFYVPVAITAAVLSGAYSWVKLIEMCGNGPILTCVVGGIVIVSETEREFFKTAMQAKSVVLLQAYLDRYPQGSFVSLAKALIDHLEKEKSARDAATKGQERVDAADQARKQATAKQDEEQRRLQAAKQTESAQAREKLRVAAEATKRAETAEQAALRDADQARKEAKRAKDELQRVIGDADQKTKVVSTTPPGAPPTKAGDTIRVDFGKAKALRTIAISKDGSLIAVAGDDSIVRLLNTADLRQVQTLKGHTERVCAIAFSPDGKLLASTGWDGTIKVWTLGTQQVETFTSEAAKFYSLAFEPKVPLKFVLAGDGEGAVHIWDLQKKTRVGKPENHDGPVRAISFYPDASGRYVSIGTDGQLFARYFTNGKSDKTETEVHTGEGFFAAYSADGARVVTAGGDKKVKLWQASDFTLLKSFDGHSKYVLTAAISPDGKSLASGGGDSVVILWDIQSGQVVRKLVGHQTDVESVAFYRDGTKVVSVSEDKTLRVWDRATGAQLAVAVGFTDGGYVAYSRDGKYTWSEGGHAHLKLLQNGTPGALDKETEARLFSPSGLKISLD